MISVAAIETHVRAMPNHADANSAEDVIIWLVRYFRIWDTY